MVKKKIKVISNDDIDIDECLALYVFNNSNSSPDNDKSNNRSDSYRSSILNITNDNDDNRITGVLFGCVVLRKAVHIIQRNVTHVIVNRVAILAANTFYKGYNKRKYFHFWLNKARVAAYYIKALEKRCLLRRGLITLRSRVTTRKSNDLRRKHLLSLIIRTWRRYVIDTINDASPMMSSNQVYAAFKWISSCYKNDEPTYPYSWINTYSNPLGNYNNNTNTSFNYLDDSGDLLNLSVYSNPVLNTSVTISNTNSRIRTYLMGHLFLPSFKYPLLIHSLALLDIYMQRYLFILWKERVMTLLTFRHKVFKGRVHRLLCKWVDYMDTASARKTYRRMIVKRVIMNGYSAKYLIDVYNESNSITNSYDNFTFQANYHHIYKQAIPRMRSYQHTVFEQKIQKHVGVKFFILKKLESSWKKWNECNSSRSSHKLLVMFATRHYQFKMLKKFFNIFWYHHCNVGISNDANSRSNTIIKSYRNVTNIDGVGSTMIISTLKANRMLLMWVNRKILSKVQKKLQRVGFHHHKVTCMNKAFNSIKVMMNRLAKVKDAVVDR